MVADYRMVLEVKTENEAREQAARRWSVSPDDLIVKVLDEEKAFFGLFGRKLRVEVRQKDEEQAPPSPVDEDPQVSYDDEEETDGDGDSVAHLTKESVVQDIVKLMGLQITVNLSEDGRINLSGADAGIIIGKHGDTMKSLEYLSNLIVRHACGVPRGRLDSDGYRERREAALERLAESSAREALSSGRTVYLNSMTSWERRIIHIALKDRTDVETHSVGVDPDRKVAIRLTQQGRKKRGARKR